MEEELKSCPICGETQYIGYYYEDDNEVSVLCHQCTFETHVHRSEKSAARDWNALPRRLRWTKEKPTQSEQYWYKDKNGMSLVDVNLEENTVLFFSYDVIAYLDELTGEWSGPIPEPEENER